MSTAKTNPELAAMLEFAAESGICITDKDAALAVWLAASDDGYIQAEQAVKLFPGRPELHRTMWLAEALKATQ